MIPVGMVAASCAVNALRDLKDNLLYLVMMDKDQRVEERQNAEMGTD